MSEFYDPRTGSLEAKPAFAMPKLDYQERQAAIALFEISEIKGDAADYVGTEEDKVQQQAELLRARGIEFLNSAVLINFSEDELLHDALFNSMEQRRLLQCGGPASAFMRDFVSQRRRLASGGVLLADFGLQMLGEKPDPMSEKNTQLAGAVGAIASNMTAIQLGVVPVFQAYNQSEKFRNAMQDRKCLTPDITKNGNRVTVSTRSELNRGGRKYLADIDINGYQESAEQSYHYNQGHDNSRVGTCVAIVENEQII